MFEQRMPSETISDGIFVWTELMVRMTDLEG